MDVETTQSQEDSRLIKRYLRGDEYAVKELVMKYQRKVYTLAYRMTMDIEESKDITQKTFIKAFRNIRDFRGESSFNTWLYQIALNTCLNHINKKDRRLVELDESIPNSKNSVLSQLIEGEKRAILKYSLGELPERQRAAIVLRVYEGLSVRETAEIMRCSEGAVKAHYHNGMKRLREIFKRRGYEIQS
jgi:RNA polymerase sigma-70 factor (ECF subfamily)